MNEELKVPTMQVPPLKRICMTIGQLPTSYLETMTYYEMLVWFVNYLRDDIIPVVNANGLATKELQELYVELQSYVNNYFDNLDIQDEVDNKIQDMADSGQLTDIIAQYLGLAGMITFDSVADMKLAENLVNGSKCATLGYYNVNDGGNAFYKVRTITNDDNVDDQFIIALYDNSLIAELIVQENVYANQIGLKNDGLTDNTTKLQNAINICSSKNYNLYFNDGTYNISGISITNPIQLIGNRKTIIQNTSSSNPTITINQTGGQTEYTRTSLSGLILENNNQIGVNIVSGNVKIDKYCRIRNSSTGIYNEGNIYVDDIRIELATIGMSLNSSDNHINNVTSFNCMTHYYNNGGFNIFKNIHGWNFDDTTNNIDWTTGSIFMTLNAIQTEIINCYADTLNTIFNITQNSIYLLLNIQNMIYFINRSSYADSKPKPVFFTSTNGKVNVNSLICDFNGYIGDGTGNVVSYPNNIRIDNFIGNGVKFNSNIYYDDEITATTTADPSDTTADLLYIDYSYLTANTRNLIRKNNSRYLHFEFTLKKALASNTQIWEGVFKNRFAGMNGMQFECYAYTSSAYYPLYAYIENNTLRIWNKGDQIPSATGVILNGILESQY